MFDEQIAQKLRDIVGDRHLLLSAEQRQNFGVDSTSQWLAAPCAVVLPATVGEVRDIIIVANRHRLAVVPSGGRTGLSGGAVARNGELVLSLQRMNRIIDFSEVDGTVTVEAGVVTKVLQNFAEEQGLYYAPDFASSGSSQIGGNIATNAGGIKVIRYGMTRDWVLGLTVVTGQGEVLYLNHGLQKNNSGYDFRHLLIGSEGTLGVICEAVIKLAPPPPRRGVLLMGVDHMSSVVEVMQRYRRKLPLSACEFFCDACVERVVSAREQPRPFAGRSQYYLLLEFDQPDSRASEVAAVLFEQCLQEGLVVDGVASHSDRQAQQLWHLREDISQTLSVSQPYKNDISVTVSNLAAFICAVQQLVDGGYPGFDVLWYGHIGDGNVHINILRPDDLCAVKFTEACTELSEEMAALLQQFNGSISAEHGVGLLKKDCLHYTRSAEEIALMRGIRGLFDPRGILNPGKIVDGG